MNNILKLIKEYIDDYACYEEYNHRVKEELSLQLYCMFDFYLFHALSESFLVIKPFEHISTSKIPAYVNSIEDKTGINVAVAFNELEPYTIKKLLKEKVAFIDKGKQISLPFLALHIKKQRKKNISDIKKFTPATQLVYLYILYSHKKDFEIEEVMNKLSISKMTAFRALRDIETLGLMSFDIAGQTGRKKIYHKYNPKQYYLEGKKYLDNPVYEIVYIKDIPDDPSFVKTDLSALASLTKLNEPNQKRYALYNKNRKVIDKLIISNEEGIDNNLPMIFLTKYDIGILGKKGCADPLSIMLGLKNKDERIEIAIEELLENYEWFQGEEEW
ncbi:hypothetical protein [Succinivibrio dextrinosolvens]|jgi:hypothetical protein|uniref:hypothetical protein n=1 Tax=Succinivibrio dextrinosolvens TaxID=83771 RepID=UPI00241E7AD7|nr:hypothetical protein [Succinivibrio dextrinosolvens]MBE6422722.1 hypothetical protein [Succinivibrio dextrinosolvens]